MNRMKETEETDLVDFTDDINSFYSHESEKLAQYTQFSRSATENNGVNCIHPRSYSMKRSRDSTVCKFFLSLN